MKYKVLICGGRKFYDYHTQEDAEDFIKSCLISLLEPPEKEDVIFISGMARGADQIPIKMVKDDDEWGGIEEYHADWDNLGRKAGPLRNIRMLEEGNPDMVIAFPDPESRGTWHMVDISRKANKKVFIYED